MFKHLLNNMHIIIFIKCYLIYLFLDILVYYNIVEACKINVVSFAISFLSIYVF